MTDERTYIHLSRICQVLLKAREPGNDKKCTQRTMGRGLAFPIFPQIRPVSFSTSMGGGGGYIFSEPQKGGGGHIFSSFSKACDISIKGELWVKSRVHYSW